MSKEKEHKNKKYNSRIAQAIGEREISPLKIYQVGKKNFGGAFPSFSTFRKILGGVYTPNDPNLLVNWLDLIMKATDIRVTEVSSMPPIDLNGIMPKQIVDDRQMQLF